MKIKPTKKKTDLDKLSKNKWLKRGLNVLKKGVDMNIQITSEISNLKVVKVLLKDFGLPSLGFKQIADIDDFMADLPSANSVDFDD